MPCMCVLRSWQKVGSRLASVVPCSIGPWQCLHGIGHHLPSSVSSMAPRSWQVQLPCTAVQSCQTQDICHRSTCRCSWTQAVCGCVRCHLWPSWLCHSLGALTQPRSASLLGWQLQAPQGHLYPSAPPWSDLPEGQINLACHVLGGLSFLCSHSLGLTQAKVGSVKWVQLSHCCPQLHTVPGRQERCPKGRKGQSEKEAGGSLV